MLAASTVLTLYQEEWWGSVGFNPLLAGLSLHLSKWIGHRVGASPCPMDSFHCWNSEGSFCVCSLLWSHLAPCRVLKSLDLRQKCTPNPLFFPFPWVFSDSQPKFLLVPPFLPFLFLFLLGWFFFCLFCSGKIKPKPQTLNLPKQHRVSLWIAAVNLARITA